LKKEKHADVGRFVLIAHSVGSLPSQLVGIDGEIVGVTVGDVVGEPDGDEVGDVVGDSVAIAGMHMKRGDQLLCITRCRRRVDGRNR
jgi:hypothetical protein